MSAHLTLFIAGDSSENRRDAVAIRQWCDRHLHGHYRLEVRDILAPSEASGRAQVLATPVLVLETPPARVTGDLSDVPLVMATLGLRAVDAGQGEKGEAGASAGAAGGKTGGGGGGGGGGRE